MKKSILLLLAAAALVVTGCKPKEEEVVDPSLEMTNEYELNVVKTLYGQFSTDRAKMVNTITSLGFTDYIGTSLNMAYYRKGESMVQNAPSITVSCHVNDFNKVTGVTYFSYSAENKVNGKAQFLNQFAETVKIAGYDYKFIEATFNKSTFTLSYSDMLTKISTASTSFNAKWQQAFEHAVIVYRPMVIDAEYQADKNRTQLFYCIDAPYVADK